MIVNLPPPAVAWSLAHVAGAFGEHGTASGAVATAGHGLVDLTTAGAAGVATFDHTSLPASKDENSAVFPSRNSRALQTPDQGPKGSRAMPARAATSV